MVFLAVIESEGEDANSLMAQWATAEDRAQTTAQQSETRRHTFLLGRAALRALLAHVTGAVDWRIRPDAKGKPQTFTPAGVAGPHISLSHTKGLLACAVSEHAPLGIDVEYWKLRNFTVLADYAFGPKEREDVARNGVAVFYRIWTLREAIAKATGVGVITGFNGHDCLSGTQTSGCWTSREWQLFYTTPKLNYSLALAAKNSGAWSEAELNWVDRARIMK